jgi:hypothetical protein
MTILKCGYGSGRSFEQKIIVVYTRLIGLAMIKYLSVDNESDPDRVPVQAISL